MTTEALPRIGSGLTPGCAECHRYLREDVPPKSRETRLRRMAERQGLRLEKSRRRDPRAREFGRFLIHLDRSADTPLLSKNEPYWFTLDEVQQALLDEYHFVGP